MKGVIRITCGLGLSPTHDPVVLFTHSNSTFISILNVIHLQPRKPPPFPLDSDKGPLAEITERMHLYDRRSSIEVAPLISSWEIRPVCSSNTSAQTDDLPETLMACAMGMDGQTMVAVGVRGSVWIWNERRD